MKKIDNEVYAIYDEETNTYMSSFVVQNKEVALRNFNITKQNLKKSCGNAEFIEELKLVKLVSIIETEFNNTNQEKQQEQQQEQQQEEN